VPVVTTLHTVLAKPTAIQRAVLNGIVDASSKIVVMAAKARDLLRSVYHVPADKIEVIAHGIPDVAFSTPDAAKAKLGFAGKPVILTFGLLSPNKGVEVMIDAMPSILNRRPDAVYVVLGATHPNLVRDQGEAYRASLIARVRELGVEEHVVFLDRFVDQATLLEFISMCDVYVTPYLNEAQMTSGTLAYSFGLGRPVVSTPYWHAHELLSDGRGVLAIWQCGGDRTRNCGIAYRRRPSRRDVSARLCDQPYDDMGTRRRALRIRLRACATGSLAQGRRPLRARLARNTQPTGARHENRSFPCDVR
jgi:glycosyltransferase involved in cell wall biosynthesis